MIQVEGFDDSLQRGFGDAEVLHWRMGKRPAPDLVD